MSLSAVSVVEWTGSSCNVATVSCFTCSASGAVSQKFGYLSGSYVANVWDVAPCSPCANGRFRSSLRFQGQKPSEQETRVLEVATQFFYPEDAGDMFLRNVGLHADAVSQNMATFNVK
jgi:hypothetical protein